MPGAGGMAESGAWLLVLSSVFLCNALKILLPSCSSIVSGVAAPSPPPPAGGGGPSSAGAAAELSPLFLPSAPPPPPQRGRGTRPARPGSAAEAKRGGGWAPGRRVAEEGVSGGGQAGRCAGPCRGRRHPRLRAER